MTLTVDMIDAMVASGCSAQQIAAVVKADIVAREHGQMDKRAKEAGRQNLRRRSTEGRDWFALRWVVFDRDGYVCQYCSSAVGDDAHCDHVVPVARGGTSDLSNLATACATCNCSKGAKTLAEWKGTP